MSRVKFHRQVTLFKKKKFGQVVGNYKMVGIEKQKCENISLSKAATLKKYQLKNAAHLLENLYKQKQ